jgi:hypothetical protein
MRAVSRRFKNQLCWISATAGLAAFWMGFIYLFRPNRIGTVISAGATACLIALIQAHYKR